MFCGNCGAKIEGDYKFCIACGAALPKIEDFEKIPNENTYVADPANEVASETNIQAENVADNCENACSDEPTSISSDESPQTINYSSQASKDFQYSQSTNNNDAPSCDNSEEYEFPYTVPNNVNDTTADNKLSFVGKIISWFKGLEKNSKIVIIVLAILLLLFIMGQLGKSKGSPEPVITTTQVVEYQLYLDLKSETNVFRNTYDIEIFLDGNKVGNIANGKHFTSLQEVREGEHTITFYKNGEHSISAKEDIKIGADSTFRCVLTSKKDEIISTNVEMIESISGNVVVVVDVTGMNLSEAEQLLENKGFVNVTSTSEDGTAIFSESNWVVVSQSIEADTEIDKNDEIILICRKTDSYMGENFNGLNVSEAQEKADEMGYSVSFLNGANKDEMDEKVRKMSNKEKELWVVNEASEDSSVGNHVRLYLVYTGEVKVPNVKGMILSEAIFKLKSSDFSNIKSTSNNGKTIFDDDNWIVISQSIKGGEKARADAQIVLTCKKQETSTKTD